MNRPNERLCFALSVLDEFIKALDNEDDQMPFYMANLVFFGDDFLFRFREEQEEFVVDVAHIYNVASKYGVYATFGVDDMGTFVKFDTKTNDEEDEQ